MTPKKPLTEEEIEEIEDREDIEEANFVLGEIEAGRMKTVPWEQVKAALLAKRHRKKAA